MIFSIEGYFSFTIICVIKCVKCGTIRGVNFFNTFIVIISLPTACVDLAFLIIFAISSSVGGGNLNLMSLFLGIKYCRTSSGDIYPQQ